jgi:hypothetical protein
MTLANLTCHRKPVMPGLDPGIHALTAPPAVATSTWMAGSSPAMTLARSIGDLT